MHDNRLHFASTSGRVQRIRYMFAVAPPMSLTTPLNSGSAAILRTSLTIDVSDRDWIMRPWWAVIEQNVQPPKQPRMIVTESLIISWAGIGSVYVGCGRRVYGRSNTASICSAFSGNAGGLATTAWRSWYWISVAALNGFVLIWMRRVASMNAALSSR